MPKIKLTKRAVDAAIERSAATGKRVVVWDGTLQGFGVVARRSASASYVVQWWEGGRDGRSQRLTLGRHGPLTVDQARALAARRLGEIASGQNPLKAKREAQARLRAETVAEAAAIFFDTQGRGQRQWGERQRHFERNVLPAIGTRRVNEIGRREVSLILDRAASERGPISARQVYAIVKPFSKWCLARGLADADFTIGVTPPAVAQARERVLTDREIAVFWRAAGELGWPFANILKLLLLTGQRRSEVAGLAVTEIDLDAGTWTLPRERAKNKRAHLVDLSPAAIALLSPIGDPASPAAIVNPGKLVFTTTGKTPPSGFSKVKARLDARMAELSGESIPPWVIHDLRRTAASGMAALGVKPHIIELCLNHVSGVRAGLVSVYQRHDYRDERRAAMLAWSLKVGEITAR